jgi:hypothetical protein
MSKRAFLATVVLVWFTTATASMIGNDAAMSEPILIDPTSRYYGEINNYGGEGYAYDFCYQQNTLGYIVVSEEAAARLARWYPVRETCSTFRVGQVVYINTETNTLTTEAPLDFYSSNTASSAKIGNCSKPPYIYYRKGKPYRCTPAMRRGN